MFNCPFCTHRSFERQTLANHVEDRHNVKEMKEKVKRKCNIAIPQRIHNRRTDKATLVYISLNLLLKIRVPPPYGFMGHNEKRIADIFGFETR